MMQFFENVLGMAFALSLLDRAQWIDRTYLSGQSGGGFYEKTI